MNIRIGALLFATVMSVVACGGGVVGGLQGTTISAGKLKYGSPVQFVVNGINLDKGVTVTAPSCTNVTKVTDGTATERVFTCIPSVVGPMTMSIVGGGTVLHTETYTIPVPQIALGTTMGDVVLELDPVAAPLSVKNILQYVNANFYTYLIFHRVIPGFVIQAGGYDASLNPATTNAAIKLEAGNGLSNLRGTVAMARTAVADSATSQFFINTVDNVSLDTLGGGYAVFGKVVSGMEVVDAISAVTTGVSNGMSDVPVTPILINSMVQIR